VPEELAALDDKRMLLQAEADQGGVLDAGVVDRYRQRKQQLDQAGEALTKDKEEQEEHKNEIADLTAKWLPKLRRSVEKINAAFAEHFSSFNCQGQVHLHEGNGDVDGKGEAPAGGADQGSDLENYSLEIFVSYRKGAPMKRLGGETQSGGERSVATMLFLLTLQSVTDCPFRVVDEINQGMDARNERLVFEQIVKSTSAADTCQIFLVTPKLLPGLSYTPHVTIHCVYNGQWMEKAENWDVGDFIAAGKRLKSS